ncbi:MAG TPA: outer membrane protein transport protein [Bacteroidota bacterium]|nr:outer membrane protein transport protein [Bacteroidota bacterium]
MKRLTMMAAALAMCAAPAVVFAQIPEDALRMGTPGIGVGARAIGMGGAYTGVASDFSALYWNPAGLAQAVHAEFSMGLNYNNIGNSSTYFGTGEQYTVNATNLNTLGLVFPIPVARGSAVVAFGFDRSASFTSGLSFHGFNPNSSIIQTYARNGDFEPADLSGNLAYQLYLADTTVSGRWNSPLTGRLTQLGQILESGGLNNWSVGGAIDIGKNLSLGITLTYLSGSYRYDHTYREEDRNGYYTSMPLANYQTFYSLAMNDYIADDIAGWNAKFGLMFRAPDLFRLGITVKTPTAFNLRETFGTPASSPVTAALGSAGAGVTTTFDPGEGSSEYDIHTPWVFGAGASLILRDLVLSADAEYTDWTQLEFANASGDVLANNQTIKQIFVGTTTVRAGAEYDIHQIGLRLRAGYMYIPSPYRGDPTSFDQKYITAGLGLLLGESTMVDLAYAHGMWDSFVYSYTDPNGVIPPPSVDESVKTNNFFLTLTYRF